MNIDQFTSFHSLWCYCVTLLSSTNLPPMQNYTYYSSSIRHIMFTVIDSYHDKGIRTHAGLGNIDIHSSFGVLEHGKLCASS